jgi:hypothetical protein
MSGWKRNKIVAPKTDCHSADCHSAAQIKQYDRAKAGSRSYAVCSFLQAFMASLPKLFSQPVRNLPAGRPSKQIGRVERFTRFRRARK